MQFREPKHEAEICQIEAEIERLERRKAALRRPDAPSEADPVDRATAENSAEVKGAFLAKMSHEIRTRLDGITGILQLTLESDLPHAVRDDLRTMQDSANAVVALLGDVLDFSKIEAGQLEIEEIDFDLVNLVEDVVDQFAEAAHAKGLQVYAHTSPDIPRKVRGDAERLRQVLSTLVSNAVSWSERGDVTLRTQLDTNGQEGGRVRFSVRDSGDGFDDEALSRLFQPFTMSDGAQTEGSRAAVSASSTATGLGLSICRELCQLMGGEIRVESTLGRGSEFTFCLDFDRAPEVVGEDAGPGSASALSGASHLRDRRILVLDGRPGVRDAVIEVLTHFGAECESASNTDLGLTMLRDAHSSGKRFDAVIACTQFGGATGLAEFTKRVRASTDLHDTSVIAGIVSRDREVQDLVNSSGVDALVSKPYRRDSLLRRLRGVLDLRESNASATPNLPDLKSQQDERGLRILIAEDTRVNQVVAKRMIERLGHEPFLVSNGEEALHALEQQSYDLVLMDCQMPVMDGYEATRAIRENANSRTREIVILAMTADAMRGTRERCLAYGMNDYMTKPVRLDELRMLLERWTTARNPALSR